MAAASLLAAILFLVVISPAAAGVDVFHHLHFYLHEINIGVPNSTMVDSVNLGRPNGFGDVIVYDNVFRAGVEPSSALLGREQGLGVGSNIAAFSGLTALEFIFTAGVHNGSSFAVFGRVTAGALSDRTIIGGTGTFRMARGYILGSVVATTDTTTVWVLDAYIAHLLSFLILT